MRERVKTMNNVFQLRYNAETDRYLLDIEELHCGDYLKVLVFNGVCQKTEWIETHIEKDGDDNWYLAGIMGYQISGLFAVKV